MSNATLAQHYSFFIYPFRHGLTTKRRRQVLEAAGASWLPWRQRLDAKLQHRSKDEPFFFLPHVRRLLFPELPDQIVGRGDSTQASLADFAEESLLRLRLAPERLAAVQHLRILLPARTGQEQPNLPLRIAWADVALFPQQVGFLILKVECDSPAIPVDQLLSTLGAARLVRAPTATWAMPLWELGDGKTARSQPAAEMIKSFIGEWLVKDADSLLDHIFYLYSFARLTTPPARSSRDVVSPTPPADGPSELAPFASTEQRLLYELATCTNTASPDFLPHADHCRRLFEQFGIYLWDNWQGLALHDHTVFLATRDSAFTRGPLPRNIEEDYFSLFLVALFQRVRLGGLAGELAQRQTNLHRDLREARQLWEEFLTFQNHFWFSDPTPKPQGKGLYRRFQQGLDVVALYQQISADLQRLHDHYERRFDRRITGLLGLLTFVGLPTSWLLSIFTGPVEKGDLVALLPTIAITAALMYGAFGLLGYYWTFVRKDF